jgi:hypothetical protein
MDSQVSRSAWVGAGSALALALLTLLVAGGRPKETASAAPTTMQAPTPTLSPVS